MGGAHADSRHQLGAQLPQSTRRVCRHFDNTSSKWRKHFEGTVVCLEIPFMIRPGQCKTIWHVTEIQSDFTERERERERERVRERERERERVSNVTSIHLQTTNQGEFFFFSQF